MFTTIRRWTPLAALALFAAACWDREGLTSPSEATLNASAAEDALPDPWRPGEDHSNEVARAVAGFGGFSMRRGT
jgi:hypothetical protein